MKIRYLIIFILALVFSSCEYKKSENLETLVDYMQKIDRKDLAEIVQGSGFRAGIVYKDKQGNYQILDLDNCYNGFINAGYDKKFSRQFCRYLLYTALNEVLEKRANQLEPEVKALINEYKNYIRDKENTLETIKKIALYSIPVFFGLSGLIVGITIYRLVNIRKKEEKLNEEIYKVKTQLRYYQQEKEEEARKIIEDAKSKASGIIQRAKEEAEYIRSEAYQKGYQEGQEKHKRELKSLRKKIAAVKNIFKTKEELNECFKKTTGIDFEKWLKER